MQIRPINYEYLVGCSKCFIEHQKKYSKNLKGLPVSWRDDMMALSTSQQTVLFQFTRRTISRLKSIKIDFKQEISKTSANSILDILECVQHFNFNSIYSSSPRPDLTNAVFENTGPLRSYCWFLVARYLLQLSVGDGMLLSQIVSYTCSDFWRTFHFSVVLAGLGWAGPGADLLVHPISDQRETFPPFLCSYRAAKFKLLPRLSF